MPGNTPTRSRMFSGLFQPDSVSTAPKPSIGWKRLCSVHTHRSVIKKMQLVQYRSRSVVGRPPTPSSTYRPIGFRLPRNMLPAEMDVDVDGESEKPLLCGACRAREAGLEVAASEASLPPAALADSSDNRRVRFIDPVDTCAHCTGHLIRPCGAPDADAETLVGSDDDSEDDDSETDDDDDDSLKPRVVYHAVGAPYPPQGWRVEEDFDNSLDFNLNLGSLVSHRAEREHIKSICAFLGLINGVRGSSRVSGLASTSGDGSETAAESEAD